MSICFSFLFISYFSNFCFVYFSGNGYIRNQNANIHAFFLSEKTARLLILFSFHQFAFLFSREAASETRTSICFLFFFVGFSFFPFLVKLDQKSKCQRSFFLSGNSSQNANFVFPFQGKAINIRNWAAVVCIRFSGLNVQILCLPSSL